MKLSVNIEFDNWEEYLEFSTGLQKQFGKAILGQNPVQASKKVFNTTEKAKPYAAKPEMPAKISKPEMPKIDGFKPPEEMIQKVNGFLESGQPFCTNDVVGNSIMGNPNRRAKANQWLQNLPGLLSSYQKSESKRGRGSLVYTPIRFESGKMLLPPGQKPSKTDWPVKGAAYKTPYRQVTDEPDYDDLLLSQEKKQFQGA